MSTLLASACQASRRPQLPHSHPNYCVCSTYEPESAAYTTRRPGWSSTAFWKLKEGLSGVSTKERQLGMRLPIGSILHPSRPHHALQGAYGVKISRRASRAPFAHSITFHAAVGPFYYSSRTHRSHEHHDCVLQYYRLRYKHRQRPD